MRLKFLLVISAAYFVLIAGILYLGLQRERNREEFWIKENSSLQLHAINDNVGLEIEKLKVEIVRVATAMEANQKEDAVKALSQFAGVAAVAADSDAYVWKIDQAKPDVWNGPWYQRAKEISESESQPRFFAVQTHDDNLGSVIRSAVFFSAKVKDKLSANKKTLRLVGVLAQPLFQNILASQQGAGMQFFIFSQKGLAISHTISDYVGNSLAGDKLYEEIRKNKVALGSFSHKDFKGDAVVSMYEKIEHTDLTVVSQLRPSQWAVTDWGYYGQAYMVIFGIFCLLSGAMFFVLPKEIGKTKQVIVEKVVEKIVEKPVEKVVERFIERPTNTVQDENLSAVGLEQTIKIPASPNPTATSLAGGIQTGSVPPIPVHLYEKLVRSAQLEQTGLSTIAPFVGVSTANTLGVGKVPFETGSSTSALPTKMSILAKVISQIKAPFLSILGHVQIAKSHPQGGSLQAIENEARSAREILDRLAHFSGLSQPPNATVPLIDLIEAALRSLEGPILRGAIKITKSVSEDLCIKCDPDDFKAALTSIFRNSVEAMERVLKKELIIEANKKNNTLIELRITDSGEGILPRNMPYLFEPFYSTKSPLDHKGLGLAAVQGIMRTHLGEVSVTSDPDQGTMVKMSLPVSVETPKRLAEIQMMGRPAWMDLIKTPSRQELAASESLLEPIEIQKAESLKSDVQEIAPQPPLASVTYTINESEVDFELENFDFSENSSLSRGALSSTYYKNPSSDVHKTELLNENDKGKDKDKGNGIGSSSADDNAGLRSQEIENSLATIITPNQMQNDRDQRDLEKSLLFASPVKRLKKKTEPLDKLKVQIPRPEEKL
jgi:signal transduction histidine kinase